MLYTDFFGHKISRLVLGDNPMNGHSYIPHVTDSRQMLDYYTAENFKETIRHAHRLGINTMLPLSNPYGARLLEELEYEGIETKCIWQPNVTMTINEMWPVNMREIKRVKGTIGIYHQGTTTDLFYETGRINDIKENIKMMRELGVPVGLGTHRPEVIELAEEEDWGVDFYLGCLHNARRGREGEASGFLTGKAKVHLHFYPEDRPIMLDVLSKIKNKPVGAFKIFGGGQMLVGKPLEEQERLISGVYEEVFSKLKENDFAMIGVFQRDKDELGTNVRLFNEWAASHNLG